MSKITWDTNQQSLLNRNSYGGYEPIKEDYNQSVVGATFRQTNTAAALSSRHKFEAQEYDVSRYDEFEFSNSTARQQLTEQGVEPYVIDEIMQSGVSSWQEMEARKAYVEQYFKDQRQMGDELNTAQAFAIGAVGAITDPINLPLTVATVGVGTALRFGTLAARLGGAARVVQYGAVGAAEAAAAETVYQQTTGIYEAGSVTNAALFGMALGGAAGGLSTFVNRGSQQNLTTFTTPQGQQLPAAQVKSTRLANAEAELAEMQALAKELSTSQFESARYADEASASLDVDRANTSIAMRQEYDEVVRQRGELEAKIKEVEELRTRDSQSVDELRSVVSKVDEITTTTAKVNEALTTARKSLDEVNAGRSLGSENFNKAINDVYNGRPVSGSDAIAAKLRGYAKATPEQQAAFLKDPANKTAINKIIEKQVQALEAKAAKAASPINGRTFTTDEYQSLRDKTAKQLEGIENLRQQDSLLKAEAKKLKAREAELKENLGKDAVPDKEVTVSDKTIQLRELAAKHNINPDDPASLKAFGEKYTSIQGDINKMLEGDYQGLSDVYGVIEQKGNFVEKFANELEDINRQYEDFTKADGWKPVNPLLKKMIISPVEKLLASDNPYVVGVTRKLHAGTLHHGKANTQNAWNIRRQLDAVQNQTMRAVREHYRQAKVNDAFTGNFEAWQNYIGKEALTTTGAAQRQIWASGRGGEDWLQGVNKAKQRSASVSREYSPNLDKNGRAAVDAYLDYFELIHKRGSELEMEAFVNSIGKGYVKRIYSKEAITKLGRGRAIQTLVDAQEKFAIATNKPWGQLELEDATKMAQKAVDSALDPAEAALALQKPLGIDKAGETSVFKQRTIDAFDDDIADLLETNIEGITSIYGLQTHGRLALKQTLDMSSDAELNDWLTTLGASPKELDQLKILIETVRGVREIDKNPASAVSRATKFASSYSTGMHVMGFGIPTITEIASVAGEFGLKRTLKDFAGRPKDVYDLYRKGTVSDKNSLELMVNYGDAHFSNRATRYDADTGFDSVGSAQRFLDKANHYGSIVGGLLPITDALRMTTSSLTVDFLARMSAKSNLTKGDVKRLLDMGFDEADLPRIRKKLAVSDDGRITNMDRKTWGKLDDEINLAIQTTLDRTILEPNGATLPAIMTNFDGGGFIPRIFAKFMRFPIESIERMAYRGFQEFDATRAVGFASSFALWGTILTIKDALRADDKKLYDTEDGYKTLMMDALMYSTVAGGFGAIADTAVGVMTGKNLTSDYDYRFGGAVAADWNKLQKGVRGIVTADRSLVEQGPRLSFGITPPINIGEAAAAALETIGLIEETNK